MARLSRFFVVGLFLAMTLQFVYPEKALAPSISLEVSVTFYNIRGNPLEFGEHASILRFAGISEFIKQDNSEILCLQECWSSVMIPATWKYGIVGSTLVEKGGTPILYNKDKYLLVSSGQFDLPGSHFPLSELIDLGISRRSTWGEFDGGTNHETFFVFNVHLDSRSAENRQESLDMLIQKINEIAGDHPVILVGDFNIEEGSRSMDEFENCLGLVDAYRVKNPDASGETLNGFGRARPRRIDYLLVRGHVRVVSADVFEIEDPPSDHNPSKVTIELK